jgi:hypothetical protein
VGWYVGIPVDLTMQSKIGTRMTEPTSALMSHGVLLPVSTCTHPLVATDTPHPDKVDR